MATGMRAEHFTRISLVALLAAAHGSGLAQTMERGAPRLVFEPRISWTETLTNNVELTNSSKSGLISELAPGFRLTGNSARISVHADYQVHGLSYDTRDSARTQVQQSLNAIGSVDLFDRWAFVDVSGSIAQQPISAFGTQSTGTNINANNTETSSYRISPFLRGRFVGSSEYEIRHARSILSSDDATVSDLKTTESSIEFRDASSRSPAWSFVASSRKDDYERGQSNESDRMRASLGEVFFSELQVSVNAGREANNFASIEKEKTNTHGYSLRWTPNPRVDAAISHEKRFFGTSRALSVSYRTPRSVWQYNESRDVSATPNQFSTIGLGNIYDLLLARFASAQPDPDLRAQAVNDFLTANNIPANTPVTGGFLATRISLQRTRNFLVSWYRQRTTAILIARETSSETLASPTSVVLDDFSTTPKIVQRGLTLTVSHRVTPHTSLNVSGGEQRSTGYGGNLQQTVLKFGEVSMTTRLGLRTAATLTARRNDFESQTTPYLETALVGNLRTTF